jgi:hypothetical protein
MRLRFVLMLVIAVLAMAPPGFAQTNGVIDGKVTDSSGAVVPGVTVTLTGDVLLQPLTAVSSATGSYRFPGLGTGLYALKFELAGFKTVVRSALRMELNANITINATMEVSQVQETVTVSGETPVVDLRDSSRTARLTQETLQSIPSARDPWVMIEQTPAVMMDRSNVGGSMSGQQSNFVARGAAFAQQKWNLDGVDITDMSATGGSPVYYDFDAFEEMQISTGGADVTMMTPGVGINLVTKSGTDKFRGSGRYYWTGERFESVNVTDELRKQGASSGAPIQDIKDYGVEVGGPIKKGRAWFWGAYGIQNIKVGVNGFFKPDASCQAVKANPLSYDIKAVWDCLNTDLTELKNYNAKLAVAPFKNNQFSFFFNMAGKIRNARGADDLHPIESTTPQGGVPGDAGLGSPWWKTGMPKTYKWGDRHVFSDRFMVEAQYAHVGNNFTLDFHSPETADTQPSYERFAPAGLWGRSLTGTKYVRPTDSIDLTGNYFLAGFLGGDHAFKFGGKIRNDVAHSESAYGAQAVDYFAYGNPSYVRVYRNSYSEYQLRNRNIYIQDTFTKKRVTVNMGLRWDYQTDESRPGTVPATPYFGQATFNGTFTYCRSWSGGTCTATQVYTTTGQPFNQLPALNFTGAKSFGTEGGGYTNWSPRVGLTYDLTGNGMNVVKFSYARYVAQAGTGDLSSTYTTTGSNSYVQYPWNDINGDKFMTPNEIVMIPTPLDWGGNYDYANPGALAKPTGKNDPNIKMEHTDEFIVSFDKALSNDFAVGASYIHRKTSDFRQSVSTDSSFSVDPSRGAGVFNTANYTGPFTYTPAASACPAGASCSPVQYWTPAVAYSYFIYTNNPAYYRIYDGFELTARKRMSHRWMANASYIYNNAPLYYPQGSYQNPTNIGPQNGGQYAPQSTTSGIDNVYVNAKWSTRFSSAYQLPWWDLGVAGFLNVRGGFPLIKYVTTGSFNYTGTTTIASSGTSVYLDEVGAVRLPSVTQLDLRLDKAVKFGRVRTTLSLDLFNALNANTVLAQRRQQNSSNANQISAILAPRVLRFGARVTF